MDSKDASVQATWLPPPEDVVKVNVDVAVCADFVVAYVVIRDQYGELYGFKVKKLDAINPLLSEAKAAHVGVELAY